MFFRPQLFFRVTRVSWEHFNFTAATNDGPRGKKFQLIGRAVQLAAIALQRNTDKENFEKPRNEMSDSPPLKQFIN